MTENSLLAQTFFFLTTCKIRHHVFTTFETRIRNVKCKNKNVLGVLKSSKYISLFEPRSALSVLAPRPKATYPRLKGVARNERKGNKVKLLTCQ